MKMYKPCVSPGGRTHLSLSHWDNGTVIFDWLVVKLNPILVGQALKTLQVISHHLLSPSTGLLKTCNIIVLKTHFKGPDFEKASEESPVKGVFWQRQGLKWAQGLTQGSGHGQEGDLVDDGAAAHGAVVGQPGPLPHHPIHSRLIDHTAGAERDTGYNRKEEINEAKPVKYANVEVMMTAQWSISKHTTALIALRQFRIKPRGKVRDEGQKKIKIKVMKTWKKFGWLQHIQECLFNLSDAEQNQICLPQMRAINISSLRCKLHTIPPSVFYISQSLAAQSSTGTVETTEKEGAASWKDLLNGSNTHRRQTQKEELSQAGVCRKQETGEQLCISCEHLLRGTEHCFSSPRWHWGVKGATEQITGAAVSGREEKTTSMNHQGIRADETRN